MQSFVFQLIRSKFKLLSLVSPNTAVKHAAKLFFTPRKHQPKPIENQIKQKATKHTLNSGVVYYTWGEGKPVVFIHGWEGRATQVSAILERINEGYKVIAIDAPAHGESKGELSHPKFFVDALFEVIAHVGPVHAIIGHSMGGGSAAYAALEGIEAQKIISIAGPSNFYHVVYDFASFIGLYGRAKRQFMEYVEQFVGLPYIQLDANQFIQDPKPELLVLHDIKDKEVPVAHAQAYDANASHVNVALSDGLGHRKILYAEETVERVAAFLNA